MISLFKGPKALLAVLFLTLLTSCGLSREERLDRLNYCLSRNPYWINTYAWASYRAECERIWGDCK